MSVTAAALEAAFLWALARDLGLDGFRARPEALAGDYTAACARSMPLACEIASGAVPRDGSGLLSLEALRTRSNEWCAQHDDTACLVEGMLLVRDPFRGFGTDTAPEAERTARTAFAVACDAGVARGCTELGMAYLTEAWSYASEPWARESFRLACAGGEPEGCRQHALLAPERATTRLELKQAVALGHVEAAADLARLDDDPEAARVACGNGSSAACLMADQPDRACSLGNQDACLTDRLRKAAREGEDRTALIDTLISICPTLDRACREAEFLKDGSPVVATEPGFYASKGLVERYLVDHTAALRICHVRALKVNPAATGVFDVWMRIGADGKVLGVYVPNPFDPGLAECAERTLMTVKFKAPLMGTMLARVELPFRATAKIEVRELAALPETGSLALVTRELEARGDELDRCILTHDDPRYIREGAFRATVVRSGVLERVEWISADFEEATRACLESVVTRPFRVAPLLPTPFEAKLSFLEEYQVPTTKILREPLPPITPDRFRLLALLPAEATIEGTTTARPDDAALRVKKVHDELAALVAEWTHGGLVVETDVHPVPADIAGATLDVEDEELTRLRFEAFDVPDAVWSTLPVGRYDGIVLWLPTPPGKYADIGTTSAATLRGASFSALPLPTDRAVLPRVETLLNGFWSQWATRAEGQLGVVLPDAERVLESEGRSWDPEFWTLDPYRPTTTSGLRVGNQTGDAMPFYRYLFQKFLHPALRADLARLDRLDAAAPDDLALLSLPLREGGARNLEVLSDGRRALRPPEGKPTIKDTSWLAPDRPLEDAGWWGIAWPAPVDVRRVRARFGEGARGPATVGKVVLEGRRPDGAWEGLLTVAPTQSDVVVTLPETRSFDAVRLRVLERLPDVTPLCAEIEVYSTPGPAR